MITGTGFFTWVLKRCEGGDPDSLARVAKDAGFSHVLIKIADGPFSFGETADHPPVIQIVQALRRAGILVIGWQYVYGNAPESEADIAYRRVKELGLEFFVVNAESEYKYKSDRAVTYMNRLRSGLPDVKIGLSSYRFPTLHREFPWREFISRCDFVMPQVYWVLGNNPGSQLRRCIEEYKQFPARPIIPTGAAYADNQNVDPLTGTYWRPTPGQVQEFMDACSLLGLDGFNFWEWGNTRQYCPELWDVIAGQNTEYPPIEPDPQPEPLTGTVRFGNVVSPSGLNVRSAPAYPSPSVWFILPAGAGVEILEEVKTGDGSTWWRIGQKQYVAAHWKSPFDGQFHTFAEYV